MATIKITKAQYFEAISKAISEDYVTHVGEDNDIEITGWDIQEFINKSLKQLDDKAAKAKAKAAEKRAEGDALKATIKDILTAEFQTRDAILEQIEDEDVTPAKVTARLTALIKDGVAKKEEVKVGDKVRMAYALVTE